MITVSIHCQGCDFAHLKSKIATSPTTEFLAPSLVSPLTLLSLLLSSVVLNRQYEGFLPFGQKCFYGKGSLHQSCRVVSTTTKQGDNSAINFRKAKEIRRDFTLLWKFRQSKYQSFA